MTARTQLTPITVTQDAGIVYTAATTLASLQAAGAYIAPPAVTVTSGTGTFAPGWTEGSLLLLVNNTTTITETVTIRATGSGVNVAGTAQTSPYPSNAVFTQGSQGDLTVSLAASSLYMIWPYTSDRFTQPQDSGVIYLDFGASITGFITVFALSSPRLGGIVGA